MSKVNVTCRLEGDDVAFLDTLGAQLDRDRSYLIKQAIRDFIERQRWQVEEVQRAMAEADEGKVMTDKQFRKEVESWKL
jgi:predicted transcriptional regulator